jgi:hypothetical protein
MSSQYLNEDDILSQFSIDYSTVEPISTDSYDESAILNSVLERNIDELFACALQFAIVGCGNKTLGSIKISGVEKKVETIVSENGLSVDNSINAKLLPNELTMKRLSRFFRFNIRDYIRERHCESFLYRKYCTQGHPEFVFPGAEYLVDETNCSGILEAYEQMDLTLNTRFLPRIHQILKARKVSF